MYEPRISSNQTSGPVEDSRRAASPVAPGPDPLLALCPSCRQQQATVLVLFTDGMRYAVCVGCCPPTEVPDWLRAEA